MEKFLEKIIEMDKKARQELEDAKFLKLESEKKISKEKEERRRKYLEEARENIKKLGHEEKIKVFVKMKRLERICEKELAKLRELCEKHKDALVEKTVKMVLNS